MDKFDLTRTDTHWRVRVAWTEIHVMLACNCTCLQCLHSLVLFPIFSLAAFKAFIEAGIPKLVEIALNDTDEDVRIAGVKSLASLAQDGTLNPCLSLIRPLTLVFRQVSSHQHNSARLY